MTNLKLKYSFTVLNVSIVMGELFLLIYAFIKWIELARGDGYGLVALVLIALVISTGLVLDLILQQIITNKTILNAIGALLVLIYLYIVISNS